MKVRLLAKGAGWARFHVLEGPQKGRWIKTRWDPNAGGIALRPGDEDDLLKVPS